MKPGHSQLQRTRNMRFPFGYYYYYKKYKIPSFSSGILWFHVLYLVLHIKNKLVFTSYKFIMVIVSSRHDMRDFPAMLMLISNIPSFFDFSRSCKS